MEFDFDPIKSERNLRERGFGFDVAALVFGGVTLQRDVSRDADGELRMQAIGEIDGVLFAVVYTDRGDTRRIISARRANTKERRLWDAR